MKSKKMATMILAALSIAGSAVGVQAQTIEGLEAKVNSYTARVSQAESDITDLKNQVGAMDTSGIAENKAAIEEVKQSVEGQQQSINTLNKTTDKQYWQIDTLEKKTGVNTPLTNGATNLSAGVNENTSKIEAEASAREAADEAIKTELTTKIDDLSNTINGTKEAFNEELDGVKDDIAQNKQGIATNAGKIATNAENIEQNKQDIATNADNIAQNQQDIAENKAAIQTIQDNWADSERAFNAEQVQQIDTNKADIETIFGQLDQGAYADGTYFIGADANDGKQLTIGGSLKTLDNNLEKEINDRKTADAAQDKVIQQVNDNLVTSVNTINKTMSDGFTALSNADAAEAKAREDADKKLQDNIDAEAAARADMDLALQKNIDAEAATREAADEVLKDTIDAETANRVEADNALNSRISHVETDANKGIAKASALAALHPLDYDPDNKFDVAAAGGFYKGEKAFALGAFYRPNRNMMVSLATSLSSGDNAYNVGVTFKIGKAGKRSEAGVSTAELYAMIGAMQEKMDQQQKRIEELETNQAK